MIRQTGLHPAPRKLRRAREIWGAFFGVIGVLMVADALLLRSGLMAGYAGLWLIAAAVLGPHTISALAAMRSYRAIKLGFPRVCPECEYDNRSMETDVDVLTCPECGVTYTGDEVADLTKSFWRVWKSRGTRESSLWIKRESLVKSRQALKQYNDELKQRVETDPG